MVYLPRSWVDTARTCIFLFTKGLPLEWQTSTRDVYCRWLKRAGGEKCDIVRTSYPLVSSMAILNGRRDPGIALGHGIGSRRRGGPGRACVALLGAEGRFPGGLNNNRYRVENCFGGPCRICPALERELVLSHVRPHDGIICESSRTPVCLFHAEESQRCAARCVILVSVRALLVTRLMFMSSLCLVDSVRILAVQVGGMAEFFHPKLPIDRLDGDPGRRSKPQRNVPLPLNIAFTPHEPVRANGTTLWSMTEACILTYVEAL